jgi:hypothetical protein
MSSRLVTSVRPNGKPSFEASTCEKGILFRLQIWVSPAAPPLSETVGKKALPGGQICEELEGRWCHNLSLVSPKSASGDRPSAQAPVAAHALAPLDRLAAARAGWSNRPHDRQWRTTIRACTTSPRGRYAFFRASAGVPRAPLYLKTTAYLSSAPRPAWSWTPRQVRVEVGASGNYPLPYREMRVILPDREKRTIELSGAEGIELRL